jgi:hypothetical protein
MNLMKARLAFFTFSYGIALLAISLAVSAPAVAQDPANGDVLGRESVSASFDALEKQQSKPRHPFDQPRHVVYQLNGEKGPIVQQAEMHWISKPWTAEGASVPFMVFMPEKNRVLMLMGCQKAAFSAIVTSDDYGKMWSPRRWLSVDSAGQPNANGALSLTYLGQGRLAAFSADSKLRWLSSDYGQTWARSVSTVPGGAAYIWDPFLVVESPGDKIPRLVQTCWRPTGVADGSPAGPHYQCYTRSSLDAGQTWTGEIKVPQWLGVNETAILRASNGDWVAACRTDNPKQFAHLTSDHYCGLGVSISQDQGRTWSDVKILYEWGRHHPSMILLPDGTIVMSYVVRLGYPRTAEGFPQYGVEAVTSRDHGRTWDLQHRYVLAMWAGNMKDGQPNAWFCTVQSTSSVSLPDGTILTAFGTGFSNTSQSTWCKLDIALVRWRMMGDF